jgi:hypothetical protein
MAQLTFESVYEKPARLDELGARYYQAGVFLARGQGLEGRT